MRVAKRVVLVACVSLVGAVGLLAACSWRSPDESSGAQPAAAADPIPGEDWMARVQQQLAEREYEASHNGDGLQAPNRKQRLRTYFEPTGIRVHDRTAGGDSELVGLSVAGMGRGSVLSPVAPGEVSNEGARVEIRRDGFVEWYENSPAGLEQGFTWAERPVGEGPLAIELALSGASASVRGDELLFQAPGGRKLRYGALSAKDAAGRSLVARMELSREGRVRLEVEDTGAEYPVVLDPLLTGAADTQIEANQASAFLGFSVAAAGDVNGDGYADIIMGAYQYDAGQTNEAAAFVFLGSASGIADGNPLTAAAQLESNQLGAQLGFSVAGAGDVNGDGYADVVVSVNNLNSQSLRRALVFHGSALGIADGDQDTAATQLWTDQNDSNFGFPVAGAGDVNGDGYADVIVGAYQYEAGLPNEGAAFVFLGNDGGRPIRLTQQRGDASGIAVQPWGGSINESAFEVEMLGSHPDGRGRLKLEVEACSSGVVFGNPSCTYAFSADWVQVIPGGPDQILGATVSGLDSGTLYRWRARILRAPRSGLLPLNPAHGPWRRLSGQVVEADIRTLPEPGGALLLGSGIALLGALGRRRRLASRLGRFDSLPGALETSDPAGHSSRRRRDPEIAFPARSCWHGNCKLRDAGRKRDWACAQAHGVALARTRSLVGSLLEQEGSQWISIS